MHARINLVIQELGNLHRKIATIVFRGAVKISDGAPAAAEQGGLHAAECLERGPRYYFTMAMQCRVKCHIMLRYAIAMGYGQEHALN